MDGSISLQGLPQHGLRLNRHGEKVTAKLGAWLVHTHAALEHVAWAVYGWDAADPAAPEDETLARLLALNQARSTPGTP